MKKLNFLFLFLLFSFASKAQDWAPVGTEWYYKHTYFWKPDVDFNHWVSVKDTTVNGQDCRIIEKALFSCDFRPHQNFMFGENRRIYFFNEQTDNFETLYDFNLQAGDSLVVPNWLDENWDNELDTIIYHIDSTSTFTWNDSTYVKQYISYYLTYWDAYRYFSAIENIGGTYEMFNYTPGICDGEYDGPLRCYNSPETGLINFGSVACDFTPVEEVSQENSFNIFPNPVESRLTIQQEPESFERLNYELYDCTGQIVFTGKVSSYNHELDVSSLLGGIYMLRLFNSDEHLLTKKFIKM